MPAENAITSSDYSIYILMVDMSKAFDIVYHSSLIKDLKVLLEPDELHMISILIKDVGLRVQLGKEGDNIKTNVGIA